MEKLLHSKEHFQFFTCNYLQTEIQRHRTKLLKFTGLSQEELIELQSLIIQHITFIDEGLLPAELLLEIEAMLHLIDPDDTPFIALAKHLGGKLWTGDLRLCKGLSAKGFKDIITTPELTLLLSDLEKR